MGDGRAAQAALASCLDYFGVEISLPSSSYWCYNINLKVVVEIRSRRPMEDERVGPVRERQMLSRLALPVFQEEEGRSDASGDYGGDFW